MAIEFADSRISLSAVNSCACIPVPMTIISRNTVPINSVKDNYRDDNIDRIDFFTLHPIP